MRTINEKYRTAIYNAIKDIGGRGTTMMIKRATFNYVEEDIDLKTVRNHLERLYKENKLDRKQVNSSKKYRIYLYEIKNRIRGFNVPTNITNIAPLLSRPNAT